jgi:hypothetical protein
MIDILIPLGKGSRHDDIELRYCLRSIEKYLLGYGNVFIVGEKPDWIQNVIHIPCKDDPNGWQRAYNICRKIMTGINYLEKICLSDNFLFFNDDHFLLKPHLAAEFPYYHRGPVNTKPYENNRPQVKQMMNTVKLYDHQILDFDIHCPILYNKELFKIAFAGKKWPEYGYGIKSLYCAEYEINGRYIDDCKIDEALPKERIMERLEHRQWFSIGDNAFRKGGQIKEVLQELFPDKSKFEND